MVFSSKLKVIFVHGCFWHLHRNCCRPPKSRQDYWEPKLKRNAERDKQVQQQLRRLGWRSLIIWECEVENQSRLTRKIVQFLG
jgi:DNA mismatch endonuclease (patch repair protein)